MRKIVASLVAVLLSVAPVGVLAQEAGVQSYHQAMSLGLDKIAELENYQIDFEMVYEDSGDPIYAGTVFGNQASGDMALTVDFYENVGSEDEPMMEAYPFEMLAYDHFYLVYYMI